MADSSNTTVASKIDRATIMRAAWKLYRNVYEMFGKPRFDRKGFRWALVTAWVQVKERARLASLSVEVKQARADAIRSQIDGLKYKSFQINTEPMRARLQAKLSALAA